MKRFIASLVALALLVTPAAAFKLPPIKDVAMSNARAIPIGFPSSTSAAASVAPFSNVFRLNGTITSVALGALYTAVMQFNGGATTGGFGASGNNLIIYFGAPASGSCPINSVWIGPPAGSGNPYNFDGTQFQAQFDNSPSAPSNTATLTVGSAFFTVSLPFTINTTSVFLVAIDFASTCTIPRFQGIGTGNTTPALAAGSFVTYYKTGINQAATTSKATGYTSTGTASAAASWSIKQVTAQP